MSPHHQRCRADAIRAGDWLLGCPLPTGRKVADRCTSAARARTSELRIEVNGLTITYPATDAVVLSVVADGGTHTADLAPDQELTREVVTP